MKGISLAPAKWHATKNSYQSEITSVYDDMTTLCRMFCPEDLEREMSLLNKSSENSTNHPRNPSVGGENDDEEDEEKEEEKMFNLSLVDSLRGAAIPGEFRVVRELCRVTRSETLRFYSLLPRLENLTETYSQHKYQRCSKGFPTTTLALKYQNLGLKTVLGSIVSQPNRRRSRNDSGQAHFTVKMPVRKEGGRSARLPIYTDTPT